LILKFGCLKENVSGQIPQNFKILRLCLILENKTDVNPSDKVFRLIKGHSLHTLFAVFEKNGNFQKNQAEMEKFQFFFENGKQGVQTVRLDELNNFVTWVNISFIFQN